MSDLLDDYFAFEAPLVAQVKATLPGVRVRALSELGDVQERMNSAPAVFVGYAGDSLVDEKTGAHQRWHQDWWTVVAVRSAAQTDPGAALRDKAGPLLASLIVALGGWSPNPRLYGDLARVSGPPPNYYIGYAEFPLRWQTLLPIRRGT